MPRTPSDKPKPPRGAGARSAGKSFSGDKKPYVKRASAGEPGGFDAKGKRGGFASGPGARGPKRSAEGKPFGERAPRGEGGRFVRAEGGDFAPRSRAPRGEGDGFKPRSPRAPRAEGGDFAPRSRAPRGEGGDFAPRSRAPRAEGGDFAPRSRAPRGEGKPFGDRPRGEGGRFTRAEGGDFKPRAPRAPRDGEGFAPKGEFGGPRPKRTYGGVGEDGHYDREREHVQPAGAKAYASYAFEVAEETRDDLVYGRHAVLALLESEQPVNKVWVLSTLRNPELMARVRELAKGKGAIVQLVERPKLDGMAAGENHQGLVAAVPPVPYAELETVIEAAKAQAHPALLVLDGIEDPHNLGALLRTAEGADFAGVVIPNRRAVGLTPVVYKASAGAAARVPVARVGNLTNAIKTLKDAGFWLVGADADAERMPYDVDLAGAPVAIVLGSEGKGLGTTVAKACDHVVKLPLGGQLESLNASVAGGVLMYEVVRQRLAKA